jgi:hypothetical protein
MEISHALQALLPQTGVEDQTSMQRLNDRFNGR